MYGLHGEHWVEEKELTHLRGYLDSRPVRKGNAAGRQIQLDNWGEVVDAAFTFAERSGEMDLDMWRTIRSLVGYAAGHWRDPDSGIWEVRGDPKHYVHSKVMCWVALDRGIRLCRDFGFTGPVDDWERERDELHRTVLERGFDAERNTFVRSFGGTELDAALLEIPIVRFLPGDDSRVTGTIDAIREQLGRADLVYRYLGDDSLEGKEGTFLACSFWLVQALALNGRLEEAKKLFEDLSRRSNELGLFPEELDPETGRFLGNYPQGLTHIALINAAATIRDMEPGSQPRGR